MEFTVKEIQNLDERLALFDLYHQLNPRLDMATYHLRTQELIRNTSYGLIGVYHLETCIGMAGYWIGFKLYCGKYLEPDNVVTRREYRSMGVGDMMQKKLEAIAAENNCNVMMLDAYLDNHRGHNFYERYGYVKKGYHFIKKL